jgi:coenzyme F420-reducing hydrogenase gamma subunit
LSGCGARCPSLNIPCVGCHGPIEEAHYDANYRALQAHDISKDDIIQKMGIFASSSWVPSVLIKSEAEEQEGKKYA